MASMKEESMVLFSPDFLSDDTAAAIHPSTQKAVDLVLSTMQGLAQAYKTFLLVCGQKRDFFTVTIKFHLKMEEVRYQEVRGVMCEGGGVWCVCVYSVRKCLDA